MTWRQLEAWAEKNGFAVTCGERGADLIVEPIGTLFVVRKGKPANKRALCRSVTAILESER